MTNNQVVYTMFEINTSIHMVRIVIFWDLDEYPGLGALFIVCLTQDEMDII